MIDAHAVRPHAQVELEVVSKERAVEIVELGQELLHIRVNGEAVAPRVLNAVE